MAVFGDEEEEDNGDDDEEDPLPGDEPVSLACFRAGLTFYSAGSS